MVAIAAALMLAPLRSAQAWPRIAASLGADRTLIREDASTQNPSNAWRWAPAASVLLRWPVMRALEFETGVGLSAVGRQDEWVLLTTAPGGVGTVRTPFTVKQTIHAFEFPVRLRLVAPQRSGWFADAALVPAYLYSADLTSDLGTSAPAMPGRARQTHPEAVIFEGLGATGDLRAGLYPWDLRVSGGGGRRFVHSGHAVDAALRWEDGVVGIRRSGLPSARTRILRAALTYAW